MDVRQQVLSYYLDNFDSLPVGKQIHFSTRMALWLGSDEARAKLKKLAPHIVPTPLTDNRLTAQFTELLGLTFTNTINAAELRAPFLIKYPEVRSLESALFRLHSLRVFFGIDARDAFMQACSIEQLRDLEKRLLQDDQALRMLSTYALNCIYLIHTALLGDIDIDQQHILDLHTGYNTSDPQQLQLLIYLYTHSIICESHFYSQRIPSERLDICRQMLAILELHITENFAHIHLDNKLEFLVCCQICSYETPLAGRINDECNESLSTEGSFIVDRHNHNKQHTKQDFAGSEHRNALFIMSGSAFTPHPVQI